MCSVLLAPILEWFSVNPILLYGHNGGLVYDIVREAMAIKRAFRLVPTIALVNFVIG